MGFAVYNSPHRHVFLAGECAGIGDRNAFAREVGASFISKLRKGIFLPVYLSAPGIVRNKHLDFFTGRKVTVIKAGV